MVVEAEAEIAKEVAVELIKSQTSLEYFMIVIVIEPCEMVSAQEGGAGNKW